MYFSCQQLQEKYEKKSRLKRREVSPFKKQQAAFWTCFNISPSLRILPLCPSGASKIQCLQPRRWTANEVFCPSKAFAHFYCSHTLMLRKVARASEVFGAHAWIMVKAVAKLFKFVFAKKLCCSPSCNLSVSFADTSPERRGYLKIPLKESSIKHQWLHHISVPLRSTSVCEQ